MERVRIGVVGLGYVGLPLAVEFGKQFETVGFDIKAQRVAELRNNRDSTLEVAPEVLGRVQHLRFSDHLEELTDCNVYIVTVPTPVDAHHQPDLTPLRKASEMIGRVLSKGDCVIYESTVYPGATEEVCIPILESKSLLHLNEDFIVGYSPERINPGDKQRPLVSIQKITSASSPEGAEFVDSLYQRIITGGTYKAPSLKVAEAAKVIENTQRDVNIALINELAILFERLEIDTQAVLEAAGTKWNFLPFRPGLVGGHCIGVDPYYLTHKAQEMGHHPDIILASRRINDGMGEYLANRLVMCMLRRSIHVPESNVLILGLAFKENCPDLRNSRIVDVVKTLTKLHVNVDVYDPWVDPAEAYDQYGIKPVEDLPEGHYDAMLLGVGHQRFIDKGLPHFQGACKPNHVVFDAKHVFPADQVDGRL
ncbi:Vi polysaccharide biosynthesis UDP-N-acetylglucosamine C-6 dehydrogenase TviB [Thiohalomonas denitrificans]|uniref:UDP-N-acetyl-D-galactosamine dehydrogenase n=1 Tax=Thiohalomonas denitrificans TaxID=415747 RepID=A0A1G5Q2H3_9GAMM|nr:Vi polysaccharide biosynthesis UDP-N-acetylglucosamine C-6 dehydrogenase TviB [Thiohalomonas denitrificans]SCZ55862.1 UDP-N-acetyl-D-galactosamine dehydrogenase [Thiohalomonas denitrificans]